MAHKAVIDMALTCAVMLGIVLILGLIAKNQPTPHVAHLAEYGPPAESFTPGLRPEDRDASPPQTERLRVKDYVCIYQGKGQWGSCREVLEGLE